MLTMKKLAFTRFQNLVILDMSGSGNDVDPHNSFPEKTDSELVLVIIASSRDEAEILKTLPDNADAYVIPQSSPTKHLESFSENSPSGTILSPVLTKQILNLMQEKQKRPGLNFNLTSREIQVLKLLMKGYMVKAIASKLNISYETGRSHLKNIYKKLEVDCGKKAVAKVHAEKINLS